MIELNFLMMSWTQLDKAGHYHYLSDMFLPLGEVSCRQLEALWAVNIFKNRKARGML